MKQIEGAGKKKRKWIFLLRKPVGMKVIKCLGQSEEEEDVHDEEGRNISRLKTIFLVGIINKTTC